MKLKEILKNLFALSTLALLTSVQVQATVCHDQGLEAIKDKEQMIHPIGQIVRDR